MITRRTALALMGAAIASPALANRAEIYKGNANIAVNGYDVVGYFSEGAPVEGLADFSAEWMGATWQFANAANPEDYAPQFGGHCAYAASKGALASTVPEAWTIVEGRLYLNYSLGVRDIWRRDIASNIALAEGFWPSLHAWLSAEQPGGHINYGFNQVACLQRRKLAYSVCFSANLH